MHATVLHSYDESCRPPASAVQTLQWCISNFPSSTTGATRGRQQLRSRSPVAFASFRECHESKRTLLHESLLTALAAHTLRILAFCLPRRAHTRATMQSLLQHAAQRVVLGSWCRGHMHGSVPLALVAELCHGHAASAGHGAPATPAASPFAAYPVTSAISSYPAGHQSGLVMAACRSLATWRPAASCAAPSSCSAALRPAAACQLTSTSQHSSQSTFSAVAAGVAVPAASQPPAREPTANPGPTQPPPPPWTFTQHLRKRKTLPKRMGHMLQVVCVP